MNQRRSVFPAFFTVVMLIFVLFLVWYIPSVSARDFLLRDTQLSLETNQGRERKQQYEYDKVAAEIPELRAELDQILPETEQAQQELETLREQKKKLKKEKKALEKQLSGSAGQEDADDD
jgi:septal ring factor EnvC (AmiA/AmiB activator)